MPDPKAKLFFQSSSWKDVVGPILQAELENTSHPDWLKNSLHDLLETLSPGEDPRPALQQYGSQLSRWQKYVENLQEQLQSWSIYRERKMRHEPDWWEQKKTELDQLFEQDPRAGIKQWLLLFASTLAEWNLPGCQRLLDGNWPFPAEFSFVPLMIRDGFAALRKDDLQEASDMLEFFLEPWIFEPGEFTLDPPPVKVAILVLLGRCQPGEGAEEKTLAFFEQARSLPIQDGGALSALGHFYRVKEETEKAQDLFNQAIRQAPNQPEAYAGMGMLFDDQKAREAAQSWYAEAADRALQYPDPNTILERLKAPVSGNLYYALAMALVDISPDWSLQACEKALTLGMKGAGDYPSADAFHLKGSLLEKMGRGAEAALAKYEAGRRYGWDHDLPRAIEVLREAYALDSQHQGILFYLSDSLRLLAVNSSDNANEKAAMARESITLWEQGSQLGDIPSELYWIYLSRALANELLVTREEITDLLLEWESLYFMERYLLFDDTKAFVWGFLSRFYRALNLQSNNGYAIDRALDLDPEDINAREEKIIRLSNRGEFEAAMQLLEPLLEGEDKVWARSVKAFVSMHESRFEETLALSEENQQENWVRNIRAVCYLELGKKAEAQREYQALLDNQVKQPNDNSSYAMAIIYLNLLDPDHAPDLDQAISLARKACENKNNLFEPTLYLGLALLLKGEDLPQAAQLLKDCIHHANNRRELQEIIAIYLPLLKRLTAHLPIGAPAAQIFDETARLMGEHMENVEQTRWAASPAEELEQQLERLRAMQSAAQEGETDRIARAISAAQAGLARMAMHAGDWPHAATMYLYELNLTEIPEVASARVKSLSGWLDAACKALDEGQFERAVQLLISLGAEPFASATRELAVELAWRPGAVPGLLASARLGLGEQEAALKDLLSALEQAGEAPEAKAVQELGTYLSQHISGMEHFWLLDAALATITAHNDLAGQARRGLTTYLVHSYKMDVPVDTYPVATPIAVEIGPALIPQDPDDWPVIRDYLPQMRERIKKTFGVALPGTRFRGNESLAADSYIIILHEVPLVMGTVSVGKQFCLATAEKLLAAGIPAAAFTLLDSPFQGAWLEPEQGQLTREHGLEVWQDPAYFTCRHLEAFLTRNLESMLLLQDVDSLLAEFADHELIATALPDDTARIRFTRLLRALLRESIPITNLADILNAVKISGLPDEDVTTAVEYVRCQLKPCLPGNQPGMKLITIPGDLEDTIESHIQELDGKTSLVIPPEDTQDLLSQLREVINASTDPGRILVVEKARIRPYVRRLIELEFEHIHVMSREEVSSSPS